MATYPALDVRSRPTDALLALIDDFAATALEDRDQSLRVFFSSGDARAHARTALAAAGYAADPVDVDDGDWARRSQEGLAPVTVGRLTIAASAALHRVCPAPGIDHPLTIVIEPSMGFGTGHHASTRLCLRALQQANVSRASVLDVGTGSGVLAIAAVRLGAARALGIDHDPDAIAAATANLRLNADVADVEFRVAELSEARLPPADLVTANLTGALLVRAARRLSGLVRPRGTLIVSGILDEERDGVVQAVARNPAWEAHEEGWTALLFVL